MAPTHSLQTVKKKFEIPDACTLECKFRPADFKREQERKEEEKNEK